MNYETWRSAFRDIVPDEYMARRSFEQCKSAWEALLDQGNGTKLVCVAEDDAGQIIGFAVAGPERTGAPDYQGELEAIYILHSHQRQGVGRRLVHRAAEWLVEAGFTSMIVWTLADSPYRGFYQVLGGKLVREKERQFGEVMLPLVAYGWPDAQVLLDGPNGQSGSGGGGCIDFYGLRKVTLQPIQRELGLPVWISGSKETSVTYGCEKIYGESLIGAPDELDIRCPRCQARALFDEPFEFYGARSGKPVRRIYDEKSHKWRREEVDLSGFSVKTWDGWFVVEKYPGVAPCNSTFVTDDGRRTGVVKCSGCHSVFTHALRWPGDAFYRWEIRGVTLWAWSRAHALALLEFIKSDDRDALRYPLYKRSLQRLPKAVLLAKNRDLVVREIARTLAPA